MKLLPLFFLIVIVSFTARAKPCFTEHLREAMAVNRDRMPRYAALTADRSLAVSRALIQSEEISFVPAWWLEREAEPFQAAGVPILCDDFVSMKLVPPFAEHAEEAFPRLADFEAPPAADWARALETAYESGGFAAVHAAALEKLSTLESRRAFHCMVRHVLESTARIAYLAPRHERIAKEKGLTKSPAGLSWKLVKLHLQALKLAGGLDTQAAPLQAAGVPILCRDVPPIETSPKDLP